MLVFWKEKLIFFAMTKTGSTSLEGALAVRATVILRNPPTLKHTPVHRYERVLKPFFETGGLRDLSSVAVIRHPVSWLGSWYRYRARNDLRGKPNSTAEVSFDTFVEEYCKPDPADFAKVGYPAKFLEHADGTVGVDHLFQYEQMDKAAAFFSERLSTTLRLPQKNVSPRMELSLSPGIEARLKQTFPDYYNLWEQARK